MLDLAILGLLGERDRHGYEIRRALRDQLGLVANVSFGSLYPALARLERLGAVVVVDDAAPSPSGPSTGSLSGERATSRGRRPALARHLPPSARCDLLERRRAELVGKLADLELASASADLDTYAKSVVDHAAEGVRLDIDWLDGLLDAERGDQDTSGATALTTDSAQ